MNIRDINSVIESSYNRNRKKGLTVKRYLPVSSRAFRPLKRGLWGQVPAFSTAFRTKASEREAN